MDLTLVDLSAVVVAQTHNPTVFHPAFLSGEGIVPAEWSLAADPFCTPALAQVAYQNGLSIVVQPARMTVKLEDAARDFAMRVVTDITRSIITKLPYVPYKAVGINLTYFAAMENAEEFMVSNFLPERIKSSKDYHPTLAEQKIVYATEGSQATLSFAAGGLQKPDWPSPRSGVICAGNFHFELQRESPVESAVSALGHIFRAGDWYEGALGEIVPQFRDVLRERGERHA